MTIGAPVQVVALTLVAGLSGCNQVKTCGQGHPHRVRR
jgi:hypothetical protein